MSLVVSIFGYMVAFLCSLYGMWLSIDLIFDKFGFIAAAISIAFFPATLMVVPWYEAIANSNWMILQLVYGGLAFSMVLEFVAKNFRWLFFPAD